MESNWIPLPDLGAPAKEFTSGCLMKIQVLPVASASQIHSDLAAEYNLRTNAINDGKQNLPAWDSTDYSVTESRILTDIKAAMEEVTTRTKSTLHETEHKLTQLQHELGSMIADVDTQKLERDLADLYSDSAAHRHYTEYYRDFKVFEPHWRGFRVQNGINRPAHYPESLFTSFTWIIFVIFIEAIANSYLFAKGSDFGLIGGVFQALIVSILNAGILGFLMGFVAARQINHISTARKIFGGVAACLILVGVVIFNLAVGHYRQQLVIGSLEPARDALTSFSAHPAALADFEAWLLFFVGLTAFMFSAYKCYHLDDPYPGYGEVDRRFRALSLRVKSESERLLTSAQKLLDSELAKMDGLFSQYSRNFTDFSRLAPTLPTQAAAAVSDVKTLNDALRTLLMEYRDTNGKVRAAKPCEYWSFECTEGDRFIQDAESMRANAEALYQKYSGLLEGFKQKVASEQKSISDKSNAAYKTGSDIINLGASRFKEKLDNLFHADGTLSQAGDHRDARP